MDPSAPPSALAPLSETTTHEGVVELAQLVEELEDPADLLVGVGEEAGEALHEAGGDRPLVGVELRPRAAPTAAGAKSSLEGA